VDMRSPRPPRMAIWKASMNRHRRRGYRRDRPGAPVDCPRATRKTAPWLPQTPHDASGAAGQGGLRKGGANGDGLGGDGRGINIGVCWG
jgi:hypothetical protein